MSAFNWFKKCFNPYINFNGRARRKEYWFFVLFNAIFASIASALDSLFFGSTTVISAGAFDSVATDSMPIISGIYTLAVLLPSLSVSVRRLHDTGRSGWWILLNLVPFVGQIVLLVFLVQDSIPAANQYGEDPKMFERAQQ